jgi:hypothetical protein
VFILVCIRLIALGHGHKSVAAALPVVASPVCELFFPPFYTAPSFIVLLLTFGKNSLMILLDDNTLDFAVSGYIDINFTNAWVP